MLRCLFLVLTIFFPSFCFFSFMLLFWPSCSLLTFSLSFAFFSLLFFCNSVLLCLFLTRFWSLRSSSLRFAHLPHSPGSTGVIYFSCCRSFSAFSLSLLEMFLFFRILSARDISCVFCCSFVLCLIFPHIFGGLYSLCWFSNLALWFHCLFLERMGLVHPYCILYVACMAAFSWPLCNFEFWTCKIPNNILL